ncbi:MAG: hypothetical protein COB37_06170 [Kordiimonadales bacterium]|nr:MAG: hypothetical protein COB37_06170 [Kordiimonadales bacterium]
MVFENAEEVAAAINTVLEECLKASPATPNEVYAVLTLLSRLAMFIETHPVELPDDNDRLIPEAENEKISEIVTQRFPNWKCYNQCADISVNVGETTVVVTEAASDIAGIVCELTQIKWVFDNESGADALWHLHDGYLYNWREFLLNLKLYEHALFNER